MTEYTSWAFSPLQFPSSKTHTVGLHMRVCVAEIRSYLQHKRFSLAAVTVEVLYFLK